jgi:hypothetical protein
VRPSAVEDPALGHLELPSVPGLLVPVALVSLPVPALATLRLPVLSASRPLASLTLRLLTLRTLGLSTVPTLLLSVTGSELGTLLPRVVRSLPGPVRGGSALGATLVLLQSPGVGLPGVGGPQVWLFGRLLVGLFRRRLLVGLLGRRPLLRHLGGHLLAVGLPAPLAGGLTLLRRELLSGAGLVSVVRRVARLTAEREAVATSPRSLVARPLLAAGLPPVVHLLLALRLPTPTFPATGLLALSAVSRRRRLFLRGLVARRLLARPAAVADAHLSPPRVLLWLAVPRLGAVSGHYRFVALHPLFDVALDRLWASVVVPSVSPASVGLSPFGPALVAAAPFLGATVLPAALSVVVVRHQ